MQSRCVLLCGMSTMKKARKDRSQLNFMKVYQCWISSLLVSWFLSFILLILKSASRTTKKFNVIKIARNIVSASVMCAFRNICNFCDAINFVRCIACKTKRYIQNLSSGIIGFFRWLAEKFPTMFLKLAIE